MLYKLQAAKLGGYLTVTTCPAMGLRPQIEITPSQVKRMGGIEGLKKEAERQAIERGNPLGIMDYNGNFVFKSSNWPAKV